MLGDGCFGWFCDRPLSDAPSWIPDIRLTAGIGRKRNDRFGVRNGNKQTFVLANCRQQIATLLSRSVATGTSGSRVPPGMTDYRSRCPAADERRFILYIRTHRQGELNGHAGAGSSRGPYVSAVRFNDRTADR